MIFFFLDSTVVSKGIRIPIAPCFLCSTSTLATLLKSLVSLVTSQIANVSCWKLFKLLFVWIIYIFSIYVWLLKIYLLVWFVHRCCRSVSTGNILVWRIVRILRVFL
jgi:hypothetical protein